MSVVRVVCCQLEVFATADHSSRGVLPTVVRRCVWSRNLVNGGARNKQTYKQNLAPTFCTNSFICHLILRHVSPLTFGLLQENFFTICSLCFNLYVSADKSLARPGRKQAAATKLFCKALKNSSEVCPSNQVRGAAMTSASDEKWRPFNCFFQSGRAKDLSAPL